jgi:YggT family protein
MLILAGLLRGIAVILDMLLGMLIFLVVARAIISWVNADPYNPIVRFFVSATEPLLQPLRRVIPIIGGGLDLSPIVLLLGLYFLKAALVETIADYAAVLRQSALTGAWLWERLPLHI